MQSMLPKGGQDVDQEPADELGLGQPHDLLPVAGFDAVILPAERDGMGIGADQARVGNGDAVGIAAEIGQHGLGTAKRWFGVDDPFGFVERREPGVERICLRQSFQIAVEGQFPGAMQRLQPVEEQAPEQARQHADMQEEPGLAGDPLGAIRRQAAAGHDHMDMRMVSHGRAPGVQNAGQAHLRTHALGIGSDGHDRFRRRFE